MNALPLRRSVSALVLVTSLLALPGAAFAKLAPDQVIYSPTDQAIEGVMPLTSSYVLSVTSPPSFVPGSSTTVTLRAATTSQTVGDPTVAASYVSFSPATLTFTDAVQTQDVTVTVQIPLQTLPSGSQTADYTYQIYTDGWPAGMYDGGASINASVSLPPPTPGNAPSVTITTPDDGHVFTYATGDLPAQIPFQFTATTDSTSPTITSIGASFGTAAGLTPLAIDVSGIGTSSATGSGSFTVTAPGTYILQANAMNSVGAGMDTNTYIVTVTGAPPTVSISSPTPGATYTYRAGDPAVIVSFTFTATSNFGGVRTLTAQLDGVDVPFTAVGLGTLTATGSINLPYTTAGSHTVAVTTTDDYGSASAQSNFTVNVIEPLPAVAIATPTPNQVFTIPIGSTTMNVSYSFTTTVLNGFVVDSVSASLGTTVLTPTTTGMGTVTATSSGTLNLGPGTYTLTANGGSAGRSATASVVFVVKATLLPPSVAINSPPAGYSLAIVPGSTATIPLTFTGTSNNPTTVITQLTATLDGSPLAVSSSTLGQQVALGTSTMSVTASGAHHIVVTAKDAAGTATATRDFTITFLSPHKISGTVFFDLDGNGVQNCADFGLAFVAVKLLSATNQVLATTVTDCAGTYSFPGLFPGSYVVSASAGSGFIATTSTQRNVTMASADVTAAPIGFRIDCSALRTMTANGFTIGYWKNNIDKAIAGRTGGTQVSAAKLTTYTASISQFALVPFDGITMKAATKIMGSTSSAPSNLLAKQLLAAEYNYQNGAYLNGNQSLTFVFVAWGEAVLQYANVLPSSYVIWAKDWFDAYNNSHGGVVAGPLP